MFLLLGFQIDVDIEPFLEENDHDKQPFLEENDQDKGLA